VSEADDIAALRSEILTRFHTVHQFCRAVRQRINRSTVYMVLSGRYGGNVPRQVARIREVLAGGGQEQRMFEAIKRVACGRCRVHGACSRCDDLFRAQATAAKQSIE